MMNQTNYLNMLLSLSKNAAIQAGKYLKICSSLIENELGKDIKLRADRESEAIIFSVLKDANIPILSEESGEIGALSETYFVVDPLDGSMNLSRNMRELTCVSIAIMQENRPVAGVVFRYMMDEMFWGMDGVGAFCNDVPISTSKVNGLHHAVLATGFPTYRDYSEHSLYSFIKQVQQFKKIRMLGTAAIMGSFVAAGRVDAYIEDDIMLWDVAAATAIVQAAGGVTELNMSDKYKCQCRMFANNNLFNEYKKLNAQGV